MKWAVI